jgi:hypothetical protein
MPAPLRKAGKLYFLSNAGKLYFLSNAGKTLLPLKYKENLTYGSGSIYFRYFAGNTVP